MDKDEKLLSGVSEMLCHLESAQRYGRQGVELALPLSIHPFAMTPLISEQRRAASFLWGETGTDASCALMAQRISGLLKMRLTHCGMRIIKVPQPTSLKGSGIPQRHHYYFEFATELYTCLVGHCTDFSGAGGAGTYSIKAMFEAVSELTGQTICEVTVSAEQEVEALDRIAQELRVPG